MREGLIIRNRKSFCDADPVDLHPAAVVLFGQAVAEETEFGTDPFAGCCDECGFAFGGRAVFSVGRHPAPFPAVQTVPECADRLRNISLAFSWLHLQTQEYVGSLISQRSDWRNRGGHISVRIWRRERCRLKRC